MTDRKEFGRALREALADTGVGLLINVPLNYFLISIAFYYELTALETTIFFTLCFTSVAIVRKIYMRLHFLKRHRKIDGLDDKLPK